MKRILLPLFSLMLIMTACNNESQKLVLKGYELGKPGNIAMTENGVCAELTLNLDVDNPSSSKYTVESLNATLYKSNSARFADVALKEETSIEAKTAAMVPVPLAVTLSNPLALLSGGLGKMDPSQFVADVDMVVRKGIFKKTIHKEKMPLDKLGELVNSNE